VKLDSNVRSHVLDLLVRSKGDSHYSWWGNVGGFFICNVRATYVGALAQFRATRMHKNIVGSECHPCASEWLWNIVLLWNPVPISSMSIFQTLCEHVPVAQARAHTISAPLCVA
jgi:hypothetical protein